MITVYLEIVVFALALLPVVFWTHPRWMSDKANKIAFWCSSVFGGIVAIVMLCYGGSIGLLAALLLMYVATWFFLYKDKKRMYH